MLLQAFACLWEKICLASQPASHPLLARSDPASLHVWVGGRVYVGVSLCACVYLNKIIILEFTKAALVLDCYLIFFVANRR